MVGNSKKEKSVARDQRTISLWIDDYDDIFSDFDPRPFSTRNISDDFLHEVKKVSQENDFNISELRLLMPERKRNIENEHIIAKSLHSYFIFNEGYFLKKKKLEKVRGMLFILIGSIFMVSVSVISLKHLENMLTHILIVLFQPAGWFLVWTGLEMLINLSSKEKPDLDFFSKISKSKIVFLNI